MSGFWYKLGQTGVIVRAKVGDSSQTIPNNKGLTGLSNTSAGLIISTMADVEATPTVYTQSGSLIDTIATLGTFAAPSAGHCRFAKLDDTNLPGWVEMQFANARFAVSSAKYLGVCLPAVSGLNSAQVDLVIPLTDMDPYNRAWQFQAAMTEGYSTKGSPGTPEQYFFEMRAMLQTKAVVGSTVTAYGLDGITAKFTLTLDSASSPTLINRAT